MPENPIYQKIEAYLTGALSEEEKVLFETEIQNDKDLATEVELQKLEHDAMNQILATDLKSKMKTWDNSPPPNPFEDQDPTAETNQKPWRFWSFLGLLAIILAGAIYLISIQEEIATLDEPLEQPATNQENPAEPSIDASELEEIKKPGVPMANTKQTPIIKEKTETPIQKEQPSAIKNNAQYQLLALSAYEANPYTSTTLRSGDGLATKSDFEKAIEAFDKQKYKEAIQLLGSPKESEESSTHYFRGHIYFKLKEFQKASAEFEVVSQKELAPDLAEAQWYLLLSYAARLPESRTNFDQLGAQLAADQYYPYREKVQQLLSKVAEIK